MDLSKLSVVERKESALMTLLAMMDVPKKRVERKDWRWLLRNLAVRNSNHPMFMTTLDMLKWTVKNGGRSDND